ncbi:hypothetical protein GS429_04705 [Natronorubrum sp. JWXQ-INN-674]|uniref:Uncharacterized protein n=1 Tax=Natronorubrum halalkaliphilum TaxID=2691917 RepID=A0A6B0VIM5_9EURY|nr:hypothetical protein [Natronorubrum halalkaliphilum]MXV61374.1 hypothetical protein [Natronorubrum halalkaliphilum]
MSGSLCRRFGPGRLPYASRRDVGGGIAMAATALLAIACWFGASGLLLATDTATAVTNATDLEFVVAFGALFAPFAVLTSFLLGTRCWRAIGRNESGTDPDPNPILGSLLGTCTAVGSMIGGSIGLGVVFAGLSLLSGTLALGEVAVVFFLTVVSAFLFAVVFAGWVIVPLGAFGGWYHERAKTATTERTRAIGSGKL